MRLISSLAIALVAIFTVIVSAKITPLGLTMVANVGQPSIATSEFQGNNDDVGGRQGQVAFFFPGHFPPQSDAYQKLDCTTAISIGNSSKFAIKRSTVSRSDDPSGFTRINHDLSFQTGDALGHFKTACSFIAPATPRGSGTTAHTSVAVGAMTSIMAEDNTMIRPLKSVIGSFSAFITSTGSTFRIYNIDKSANSREFIIRNPSAHEATTGSKMEFSTISNTVTCDGYWEGMDYPKVAEATLIEGGNGIHFEFRYYLNHVTGLFLHCYGVRGTAHADGFPDNDAQFFPTALEFAFGGIYKAFTVASTPSYPPTADFETGFTSNSSPFLPFRHSPSFSQSPTIFE